MFKRTIKQFETALLWRHGQIERVLAPGRYRVLPFTGRRLERFDSRTTTLKVSGQEIILADRSSLKINVAGSYRITDPARLITAIAVHELPDHLNQLVQLQLRAAVSGETLDSLFENRATVNTAFARQLATAFTSLGLTLEEVVIKDVILPADLRAAYVESAASKARASAQLEAARGQAAALRHMANAVSAVEAHPQLIQLLSIQKTDKANQANINLHFEQPKQS